MTTAKGELHSELVARLEIRRAELSARLARVSADRRRSEAPLDPDFEEQAVERENDEVLDALDVAERRELDSIEKVFRRLDEGCFGICDECGEGIDPRRLDAAGNGPPRAWMRQISGPRVPLGILLNSSLEAPPRWKKHSAD